MATVLISDGAPDAFCEKNKLVVRRLLAHCCRPASQCAIDVRQSAAVPLLIECPSRIAFQFLFLCLHQISFHYPPWHIPPDLEYELGITYWVPTPDCADVAKSGYFVQPTSSFWASAKQAPANSVLNQRQGLFCLARFCLSHLRTNFRGYCLVLGR